MATKTPTPVLYDFRRPNKFNRDHVRALQIVGETFARQFTTVLSTSLRSVSQVGLDTVGQITYDEYVRDIPNPSFLAVLDLDPLPGSSLLHIPLPITMAMVDRLLGGPGGGTMPERPLTEIEASLVRGLLDRILHEMAYAFEPLTAVRPRLLNLETNPQFAQITSATDMVITLTFDLRVGSQAGSASLAIPFASLQATLDEAAGSPLRAAQPPSDPAQLQRALAAQLDHATVEVSVRFGEVRLSSGQIVDLRPGDVLPLDHLADAPLTVTVDGHRAFLGRAGQRGRRIACLIVDPDDRGADR
jgi:flagellar motor switch protein FliM